MRSVPTRSFAMRFRSIAATVALATGIAIATLTPAEAFGDRDRPPSGWGETRDVHHYVYKPRYHHHYHYHPTTDPYAYRYEPRGYYPYYNSGYWVPAHVIRERKAYRAAHTHHEHKFKYYKAWGYPKKHYDHVKWHEEHHPRHRHSQW